MMDDEMFMMHGGIRPKYYGRYLLQHPNKRKHNKLKRIQVAKAFKGRRR